ncbi:hypothetical protein SDC9_207891 [bioreactor metagenome]|uniref:Uncharacterized protein n=1 Tax=bioreactor metagenome TaxID=1076179 RepID=A0A645J9R4_9ZZZZ
MGELFHVRIRRGDRIHRDARSVRDVQRKGRPRLFSAHDEIALAAGDDREPAAFLKVGLDFSGQRTVSADSFEQKRRVAQFAFPAHDHLCRDAD